MKSKGYDVSEIRLYPLDSNVLYLCQLSEIYERCVESEFLSGRFEDIERISRYIESFKELMSIKSHRERYRLFGMPQVAAGVCIMLSVISLYLLLQRPSYMEFTSSGLINIITPSVLMCFLVFIGLKLWEFSLRLYDYSFNRDHRKLMEACDILTNIKLNLIHTYKFPSRGRLCKNRNTCRVCFIRENDLHKRPDEKK